MDLNKTVSGGRKKQVSFGTLKIRRLQKMCKFLCGRKEGRDGSKIRVIANLLRLLRS